jgi:hypothetical protein
VLSDFKKKFDHNNINNYLPDNRTIAMSEFFQKKFEGLPSYICDMMEVKSRIEYDDYDTEIIRIFNKSATTIEEL